MWNPFSKNTMSEQKPEDKKNILQKMKEGMDDKDEQIDALSTMVRLGILIWSGTILTLAYIKLPPALQIPEQKLDPTFIASVFTGTLATFGVQAAKKQGDGTFKAAAGSVSKADLEKLVEKAANTAPAQIIRIEQGPIKIVSANDEPPVKPTV